MRKATLHNRRDNEMYRKNEDVEAIAIH